MKLITFTRPSFQRRLESRLAAVVEHHGMPAFAGMTAGVWRVAGQVGVGATTRPSFQRRLESRLAAVFERRWMPAFAGMTGFEASA